jgi:hypothetical protein
MAHTGSTCDNVVQVTNPRHGHTKYQKSLRVKFRGFKTKPTSVNLEMIRPSVMVDRFSLSLMNIAS